MSHVNAVVRVAMDAAAMVSWRRDLMIILLPIIWSMVVVGAGVLEAAGGVRVAQRYVGTAQAEGL